MSLVTPAQVRALVETDLEDDDLADVIAREEADLARYIGVLAGERTETLYIALHPAADLLPLVLRRPTDAVEVVDNDVTLTTVRLRGEGRVVERTDSLAWTGPVEVTYEPNDSLVLERVIIELVRLTLTETGYLSETIGDYSYSRGARGGAANPTEAARANMIRRLLPPSYIHTMRLASARQIADSRPWQAGSDWAS